MATLAGAEDMGALFQQIGDLEKSFAEVELKALRRKEHDLKDLYTQRGALLRQVPEFWPAVFFNGPEDVQQLYTQADMPILATIMSFSVERYQIKSQEDGEPRSLRFTFEFKPNEFFEDTKLVKEFEYKPDPSGPGNLVSKPVPIKWRHKKKDVTNGVLDAAVELEAAENTMKLNKGGVELDLVDREGLWQYEKLREKLAKDEESSEEPSFFNWFGFRGAVAEKPGKKSQNRTNGKAHDETDDADEGDDGDDGVLDVEIFPAGEEVAISLAEDMWPNVMDYLMRAQEDPEEVDDFDGFDDDEDDEEDSEPPELVEQEEEHEDTKDDRPRKKPRTG